MDCAGVPLTTEIPGVGGIRSFVMAAVGSGRCRSMTDERLLAVCGARPCGVAPIESSVGLRNSLHVPVVDLAYGTSSVGKESHS
jgi:hypothetical protein